MTIPTLVQNYKNKAWDTAAEVFERKISEATKVMNSEMTLIGHNTTMDFVSELSKHMKIVKTCDSGNLINCFAEKFYWGADNNEVDPTELTTSEYFGKDIYETELVVLMFANGVNAIMTFDKHCRTQDPYSNQINTTGCLAMVYDVDGYKKPNTFSKDLRAFNGVSISTIPDGCDYYVNHLCLSSEFVPDPISEFGDEATYRSLEGSMYPAPLNGSYSEWTRDYVSAAKYHCHKMGMSLIGKEDMYKLTQYLYPEASCSASHCTGKIDEDRLSKTPVTMLNGWKYYLVDVQSVYPDAGYCLNSSKCYWATETYQFQSNGLSGSTGLVATVCQLAFSDLILTKAFCIK